MRIMNLILFLFPRNLCMKRWNFIHILVIWVLKVFLNLFILDVCFITLLKSLKSIGICNLTSFTFRLCVFRILCTHLFYFILQIFLKLWSILFSNIIFLRLISFQNFLRSWRFHKILISIKLLWLIFIWILNYNINLLWIKMTSILLKIKLILSFYLCPKLLSYKLTLRVILLTWVIAYWHLLLNCSFLVIWHKISNLNLLFNRCKLVLNFI